LTYLDDIALLRAFNIIGIDPSKLDQRLYEVVASYFIERFKTQGYIRALENIKGSKNVLNSSVENLQMLAD